MPEDISENEKGFSINSLTNGLWNIYEHKDDIAILYDYKRVTRGRDF